MNQGRGGTHSATTSKKPPVKDRESSQQLRKLAVLARDLGSTPSTHTAAHNCKSSSRVSDTLTQAYTHTWRQNTNAREMKIKKKKMAVEAIIKASEIFLAEYPVFG